MIKHFLEGVVYPYKKYGIIETLTGIALLHFSISEAKKEYIKMKA